MKKAFTLVVLMVTPTMAFAQGTVRFQNNASGWVRQWTSSSDPTLISVPVGGGSVELIAAPPGTALRFQPVVSFSSLAGFLAANPGWEGVATTGITTIPGYFNGGNVTINGIPAGGNVEYFVIA